MTSDQSRCVGIGGVGGSGTRVGATLLQMLGYYIGDDLNEAQDNLWFTLLFKRRSIVLEGNEEFRDLVALFFARMNGESNFTSGQRERIMQLARSPRIQHPQDWLALRARSFLDAKSSRGEGEPWGWKEPNTHIVIDRIFERLPDLRYIHFVRHPLDMALSGNQNQVQNWGPVVLDRDIVASPRTSLAYWCAAHRRLQTVAQRRPDRVLMIDFDALCASPDSHCEQIAGFVGVSLAEDVKSSFRAFCRSPKSAGRHRRVNRRKFDPEDLEYVTALGYAV